MRSLVLAMVWLREGIAMRGGPVLWILFSGKSSDGAEGERTLASMTEVHTISLKVTNHSQI